MKVLIAGGGIGGITAALCLLEAGHDVTVFERNLALTTVGAGIQISPNGVKVFERLGLKSELDAIAFRPQALEMRLGRSGLKLFSIPMREEALRRYGAPYYHIHRADLLSILSNTLPPRALHLGKELASITHSRDAVTVVFDDGSKAWGDLLIGADGIHSRVREQLFGPAAPRFTGNVAWRLLVPASNLPKNLIPPTATIWVGPGRHAVTYYLRRGELVNFVGIVERSDWQNESWIERGDIKELAADFAFWSNPITALIAQAGEAYRWALFDREPLAHWSQGHVTLLGDACHPMLPFLAQGAVMAIEDAWVLSRQLKLNKEIPAALTAYEAVRKPRTTRAQRGARSQTGIYHKQRMPAQLATYGPMWLAARLTPGVVHARQDWLYKFDVTT